MRDLLDKIDKLNEAQLLESGQPYIGIFYLINNELYFEGEHPRLIQTTESGQKNYHKTHSQYFYQTLCRFLLPLKELANKLDKTEKRAWKYYPRGRVLCSENNDNFVVYCDKHITENEAVRSLIRREMNLPFSTEFETDGAHYTCHVCNPMAFN